MVDSIDYKKIYLDSFWRTTNTAIGGRGFFDNDSEFDDEVELAWRMHFAPGITYMKHKYDK